MTPTVYRHRGFRFYFFSREEARKHIHVSSADGEAKFWLEPGVALGERAGLARAELKELERIVEEHRDEFILAWHKHFGR